MERDDMANAITSLFNLVKALKEGLEIQANAIKESSEIQGNAITDLFKLSKESSEIQTNAITDLFNLVKALGKDLEIQGNAIEDLKKIETQVGEIKTVVMGNSRELQEIKRVVDQNSLILEHEMNERTA